MASPSALDVGASGGVECSAIGPLPPPATPLDVSRAAGRRTGRAGSGVERRRHRYGGVGRRRGVPSASGDMPAWCSSPSEPIRSHRCRSTLQLSENHPAETGDSEVCFMAAGRDGRVLSTLGRRAASARGSPTPPRRRRRRPTLLPSLEPVSMGGKASGGVAATARASRGCRQRRRAVDDPSGGVDEVAVSIGPRTSPPPTCSQMGGLVQPCPAQGRPVRRAKSINIGSCQSIGGEPPVNTRVGPHRCVGDASRAPCPAGAHLGDRFWTPASAGGDPSASGVGRI